MQDGCLSVWSCYQSKALQYTLAATRRMMPELPRAPSGAAAHILSVASGPWRGPLHGPHAVTAGSELIPSAVALPPKRCDHHQKHILITKNHHSDFV